MLVAMGKPSVASLTIVLAASPIEIVHGIRRRVAIGCSGAANLKKTVHVQATFGVNEVSAAIGKHATVLTHRPVATIWIADSTDAAMRPCVDFMNSVTLVFTTAIAPPRACVRSSNAWRANLYADARLRTEPNVAMGRSARPGWGLSRGSTMPGRSALPTRAMR